MSMASNKHENGSAETSVEENPHLNTIKTKGFGIDNKGTVEWLIDNEEVMLDEEILEEILEQIKQILKQKRR